MCKKSIIAIDNRFFVAYNAHMPISAICPFCESPKVIAGKVVNAGFKPDDTVKGFVFTLRDPFAFGFGPAAEYCAACGMIWTKAKTKDAAKFLEKFGTDELKARLASL
jgi:hypothetical protein